MTQCRNEGDAEWGHCPLHSFVLTPLTQTLYFKKAVELNLCPLKLSNTDLYFSPIPHFLHDSKDYTPAFVLDVEREEYQKNYEQIRDSLIELGEKEAEHSGEIKQLPKPIQGRRYCYICRVPYADYLEHTNHKAHLHRLKTNRYRNMIAHLCRDHYPSHFVEKAKRGKIFKHSNRKRGNKFDETPGPLAPEKEEDISDLEIDSPKPRLQRMRSSQNGGHLRVEEEGMSHLNMFSGIDAHHFNPQGHS